MTIKDSLIAATAIVHDLLVPTYDVTVLKFAGVDIIDPVGHETHRR